MQYNIVFVMQFVIIYLLILLLCTLMYSVYDMTDTVLGNAGLNAKPIHKYEFIQVKKRIKSIDKQARYRNSDDVVNMIKQYANKNIDDIKEGFIWDIKYSLVKKGFLTDIQKECAKNKRNYHKISDKMLQYYINELEIIKGMDFDTYEVFFIVKKFIDKDTNENVIAHFVRHAQNYLVKEGTLRPKPWYKVIGKKIKKIIPSAFNTNGILKEKHELAKITDKLNTLILQKQIHLDMKDLMHTHISLFGVLFIVCSVTATFTLCVTVAYWMVCKNKHDSTYSVIRMM